jgi:hypothetical protein
VINRQENRPAFAATLASFTVVRQGFQLHAQMVYLVSSHLLSLPPLGPAPHRTGPLLLFKLPHSHWSSLPLILSLMPVLLLSSPLGAFLALRVPDQTSAIVSEG